MTATQLVVDGSNIATEGRTTPSLKQLDQAVRAFLADHPFDQVTVVVDASFPNRIATSERDAYEEALLAGEIVRPPAGVIGRGDAFILKIASKVGATVLSNDSFQEFHGEYPWLFEQGRLVGGVPIPEIGWVFEYRRPVRGPVSRQATRGTGGRSGRGRGGRGRGAAADDVEIVSASGEKPKVGDKGRVTKKAAAKKAPAKAPAAKKAAANKTPAKKSASPSTGSAPGRRAGTRAQGATASDDVEETTPGRAGRSGRGRGRGRNRPQPALNELLPFLEFIGSHPPGSEVTATVERYSSHGAYADVDGVACYIPVAALGDPPPRSAKELLQLGSSYLFTVTSADKDRHGIDLTPTALPPVEIATETPPETVEATTSGDPRIDRNPSDRKLSHQRNAEEAPVTPAKKKAAKKKAPAKRKAAAKKKAPAKRKAAAKKKAPAKRKAAAKKKAPAKRKAPARRR